MVQPITRDPEFKIPVPIAGRFPDLQINTPESSSQFPSDCAYTHDSAFPVYSDEIGTGLTPVSLLTEGYLII